jgi:hypothetical protein
MRRPGPYGLIIFCGLAAAIVAPPALAHPPSAPPSVTLKNLLKGLQQSSRHKSADPPIAVYAPDDGDRFVFDRTASPPLLRFESSSEIWVLQPQPGPRGDTIYKNDLGEPVLRATRLGGLTLFTLERPDGSAAALEGEAPPIHPASILSANALLVHLAQDSARASHAMQRLIEFDAPDITPESAYLVADAASVAAEAILGLSKKARQTLKLNRVLFELGREPSARLKDGTLQIIVTPSEGVAGRPSSRRIAVVMGW